MRAAAWAQAVADIHIRRATCLRSFISADFGADVRVDLGSVASAVVFAAACIWLQHASGTGVDMAGGGIGCCCCCHAVVSRH